MEMCREWSRDGLGKHNAVRTPGSTRALAHAAGADSQTFCILDPTYWGQPARTLWFKRAASPEDPSVTMVASGSVVLTEATVGMESSFGAVPVFPTESGSVTGTAGDNRHSIAETHRTGTTGGRRRSTKVMGGRRTSWLAPNKGDTVEVTTTFKSDDDSKVLLEKGLIGKVVAIDKDGDAVIEFHGHSKDLWVLQTNFIHLKF